MPVQSFIAINGVSAHVLGTVALTCTFTVMNDVDRYLPFGFLDSISCPISQEFMSLLKDSPTSYISPTPLKIIKFPSGKTKNVHTFIPTGEGGGNPQQYPETSPVFCSKQGSSHVWERNISFFSGEQKIRKRYYACEIDQNKSPPPSNKNVHASLNKIGLGRH